MSRRILYAVLFGLPGLFISLVAAVFLFGALAGALWLFVFGDNPWPASAETLLVIAFALSFIVLWLLFIALGWYVGGRLARAAFINKLHILISAVLTLLFIVSIVAWQFGVGNLGR